MDRIEFGAIRAEKEMTFAALAAYLGVTLRSVQRYEYGERRIPTWIADRMRGLVPAKAKRGR